MALSQCAALMGDVPKPVGKVRPGAAGEEEASGVARRQAASRETPPHTPPRSSQCCSCALRRSLDKRESDDLRSVDPLLDSAFTLFAYRFG